MISKIKNPICWLWGWNCKSFSELPNLYSYPSALQFAFLYNPMASRSAKLWFKTHAFLGSLSGQPFLCSWEHPPSFLKDLHSTSLFWETGNRSVARNWISKVVSPTHRTQEGFQKQVVVQEPHFYKFQTDLDTSTVYITLKHSVGPCL